MKVGKGSLVTEHPALAPGSSKWNSERAWTIALVLTGISVCVLWNGVLFALERFVFHGSESAYSRVTTMGSKGLEG